MKENDIDVRIIGVPERMKNVKENQKILGINGGHIFIDFEHEGCVFNARRAWLKGTDKPYIMVLADDVELCDNFLFYCAKVITAHPDAVISLFPLQFVRGIPPANIPKRSPYIATTALSGCAIIMKTEYVLPCVGSWKQNAKGDDTSIQEWANQNGIPIITTVPAIVQHIGDVSFFDSSRSIGRTPHFEKNPCNVNWDDPYVTSWTNIIR